MYTFHAKDGRRLMRDDHLCVEAAMNIRSADIEKNFPSRSGFEYSGTTIIGWLGSKVLHFSINRGTVCMGDTRICDRHFSHFGTVVCAVGRSHSGGRSFQDDDG